MTPALHSPPPARASAGTVRVADGSPVPFAEAAERWARAAHRTLRALASRSDHPTITYGRLAEEVQRATGIRTRVLPRNWIGGVLVLVGEECRRRGEPPLPALCTRSDGTMGKGYSGVTGPGADAAAARARARCYRFFQRGAPTRRA